MSREEVAFLQQLIAPGSNRPLNDVVTAILAWSSKALESKDHYSSLYLFMPSLCTFLFGGSGSNNEYSAPGVIQRPLSDRERSALTSLLAAESSFMQLVIRMSGDPTLLYEISTNRLPPPTQNLIKYSELALLPKIYQNRIVQDFKDSRAPSTPSAGTPRRGHASSDSPRQPSHNQGGSVKIIFAHVATLTSRPDTQSNSRSQGSFPNSPTLGRAAYPSVNNSMWQKDRRVNYGVGVDNVYLTILSAFLRFFVPASTTELAPSYEPGSSPLPSSSRTPLLRRRSGILASEKEDGSSTSDERGESALFRASSFLSSPSSSSLEKTFPPLREIDTNLEGSNKSSSPSSPWKLFPKGGLARDLSSGLRGSGSGTSESRISSKRQAESNILTIKEYDYTSDHSQSNRTAISQFVVGAFVEQWLCQNEASENLSAPFSQPSAFQLQCIRILTKHVVNLDMRLFQAPRAKTPAENAFFQLAIAAYQTLQKPLFSFLKLSLKHWKADDSFALVIDIWLTYIAPWKTEKNLSRFSKSSRPSNPRATKDISGFSDEWVPYIANNFLFYSRLLCVFMDKAHQTDLFAATRPPSLILGSSASFSVPFSNTYGVKPKLTASPSRTQFAAMERVFQLFSKGESSDPASKEALLFVLRDLEDMLQNTRSGKEALTSWVRTHMVSFEGKIDFDPVFRWRDDSRVAKLVQNLLSNVFSTINRLKTYLPLDGKSNPLSAEKIKRMQQGDDLSNEDLTPKSPNFLKPALPNASKADSEATFVKSLTQALMDTYKALFDTSQATPTMNENLNDAISQAVAKLSSLAELTVTLFNVSETRKAAIAESVGGGLSGAESGGLDYDEDDYPGVREVAPGVLTPVLSGKDNTYLTSTGRLQIKRGIRKCSPTDVPVIKTKRIESLVHSYEIEWVVNLTNRIADVFEDQYEEILRNHPEWPIPRGLGVRGSSKAKPFVRGR
ncbi:sphingomyelin phosphodiesterase 4, neutral membrane (neutral sphingomyelinase-3) [Phlyctochytrium planicorne]|nr:sphingomyelin phosphodiesterase 4, neutral membrane (neutral sphingomyelinase-3) [Phlyctochytrium planicorne]